MKTLWNRPKSAILLLAIALPTVVHGQANSWTNTNFGKWETNSNWSAGAPTNTQTCFITNASSKTVTINGITAGTTTMTVSNLTVSAPAGSGNTLFLDRVGTTPLRILSFLKIDSGGTLLVYSNSVVQVDNPTFTGFVSIDGGGFVQLLDGGALVATNQDTSLANLTTGDIVVNNGILRTLNLSMGNFPGAIGTLRLQAGLVEVKANFSLGASGGSTAAVWVTGGQLVASNATTTIGNASSGRLTVSNGTVNLGTVTVAQNPGPAGTLTVAGGILTAERLMATNTNSIIEFTGGNITLRGSEFPSNVGFFIGGQTPSLSFPAGTNRFGSTMVLGPAGGGATLWVTGGHLIVTNGTTTIGDSTPFAQLTVSNGTWRARNVNLGRNIFSFGVLTVAGGDSSISSNLNVGDGLASTGKVWVTGGQLAVTNANTIIGGRGSGEVTISNGVFLAKTLLLGTNATGRGTVTIAGGTATLTGPLQITFAASATSTVWMTGGQLNVTNSGIGVGVNGVGFMTMSNGTCRTINFAIADSLNTAGTLTMAGGTNIISGDLYLGINANSTGTVWMSGSSQLMATNFTYIGSAGIGRMTVSNGAHQARAMIVGNAPGAQGTFTVAGGVSSVYSNLTVGFTACTATGIVNVTGGSLRVTNVAGDATLDVRSGTLTISAGLLQANKIILTNPCAHYAFIGGTVLYNTAVLNPNADDDGDGIPNSYEISYGLNALNPGNANQDTDGDGLTDLQEFLAGTEPTNSLSALRITSILRTNNNIRITWTTAGGRTNRVLVATPVPGGSFTNEFSNLSSFFIIPGSGDTSTNYTDLGGATNIPSRFYKIKVIP